MLILTFLVAVVISALDPLLIVAYGLAGSLAPNWRWGAVYGLLAGCALLVLLVAIRGGIWSPKPFNVVAQLCASSLGAALVRLTIDAVRRKRAAV